MITKTHRLAVMGFWTALEDARTKLSKLGTIEVYHAKTEDIAEKQAQIEELRDEIVSQIKDVEFIVKSNQVKTPVKSTPAKK